MNEEDFLKLVNNEDDGDIIREFKRKEAIFEEYEEVELLNANGEINFPPQTEMGMGY